MSEIDPLETAARSVRVMPERFRRGVMDPDPVGERPADGEREGLPPSYRMRADTHYVDQLIGREPEMIVRFLSIDELDGAGTVDTAQLDSLTRSILAHGVLQPLFVRRDENRYRIIAGRKRLAAALAAGLTTVPCIVHQVDDARAEQLALADNLRPGAAGAKAPSASPLLKPGALLSQVWDDLNAIESASTLLSSQGLPPARRVTVDMIRAQARRASWLLQAGAILDQGRRADTRLVMLGAVLETVRDAFLPESRLTGVSLQVCVPDWNVSAVVDERGLVAALAGGLIATFGLVEQSDGAVITLIASASAGEPLSIDIAQEAAPVPGDAAGRFFDPTWTDRPGSWPALVGALTARAVTRQHGGDATFSARDHRGSTLRLTVGR